MAEEHGLEPLEAISRGHLAEAQLRAGRWSQALANARLAVEHARQAANAQVLTGCSYPLAMMLALLGRHTEAGKFSREALAAAEATEDFWFRVSHRAVLGLIALAEDGLEEAVALLEPAWSLMLERGLGDLSIFPVGHVLAEALVSVGRLGEAEAVADTLRACPVGGGPWCRAMSCRLDALVASAHGDHERAVGAIAAALDAHEELSEPFEHARTLHLAGRVDRTARSWGTARASFTAALREFDELGAAGWAEKAASDIARLPGRRPADVHTLTAREREVAELVASGLRNREIATRLFISRRTVEASLSRAYAKLGVRSRSELAARFGGGDR
jgi:DNA-binding CsgD family transcriptional regulator